MPVKPELSVRLRNTRSTRMCFVLRSRSCTRLPSLRTSWLLIPSRPHRPTSTTTITSSTRPLKICSGPTRSWARTTRPSRGSSESAHRSRLVCPRGQERLERKRVAKEEDRVSVEKGGQHSFRRYVVGVAGSGRKHPRQGREERATSPYITSRRGVLRVAQPVASSGGHRADRGGLGLRVLP